MDLVTYKPSMLFDIDILDTYFDIPFQMNLNVL